MWNIENQKKYYFLKRSNSGEVERKAKTEVLKHNKTLKEKYGKNFGQNNENQTITITKNKQTSTTKKKGCC